jgi:hypothetical protein
MVEIDNPEEKGTKIINSLLMTFFNTAVISKAAYHSYAAF